MSSVLTKEQKDIKVAAMRDFHEAKMSECSNGKHFFYPKIPYMAGNVPVIGLYRSELEKTKEEVFIELINREYEPREEKRTLYRYKYNPQFKEKFSLAPGGYSDRYNVPINALEVVCRTHVELPNDLLSEENVEDCNMTQMTCRDWASLLLKKPISTKSWLNELIVKC